MLRKCLRLFLGFSFMGIFVFSVFAQDSIKFIDKTKKGENEINGLITGDSVKGLTIKIQKEPTPKLIPAVDIINVSYSSTAITSIELKSALGKEVRANLPGTKEAERLKLYEESVKDITDLLPKVKSDARLSKYLNFRIAKVKADIAKIKPEVLPDAIKSLNNVRVDNPDSWMTLGSFKIEAELQELKGNFDAALKLYQGIGKLAGVPPDIKTDSDFLVLKLLMRTNRMAEAEAKLKEVEASILEGDPRRAQVLLVKTQANLLNDQLNAIEVDLNKVIDSTDESFTRGKAFNLLGEYYLKKNKEADAFWAFLIVDTLYSQDVDEHAKALYHLSILFDKVKNDPIRARQSKDKLLDPVYAKSDYQKKVDVEK
ncbi:MAG: hypothetical protein EBT92_01365 [Planctomycetes bacterium]|nr:hypothetical protein [Planctomycetota bacterium]